MNNIKEWIVERKTIYFIFSLFYDGMINEGIEILKKSNLFKNFANYFDDEIISSEVSKIIEEIEDNKNNDNYELFILKDHQRLFIGPDELLAPLWESVYKTKDKLLFGKIELEVRRCYHSAGLNVKESEPADYLPLQLSFMSCLCKRIEEENFRNVDENSSSQYINDKRKFEVINENLAKQHNFLKEHILSWICLWSDDVNKNAESEFWKAFSKVTKGWLENDLKEIEKVIAFFN